MPTPPRIFISYARKDGRELALRLKADLEALGQTVWLDTSAIDGGASWSLDIETAIDSCQTVLALLSKGSYESEICRSEQLRALRKHKRLIPVLVQANAERPIYIESSNYRDFSDPARYDQSLALLRADLDSPYTAPEVRRAPSTAPVLPNHFVNRPTELELLRQAVLSDRTDRRIALTALRGMGGIGKSVLANALCHDDAVRDAFPDGIFWVEIGREVSNLVEKIKSVALILGDDAAKYASYDLAVSSFRLLLPQKSALIVLDDVWERGVIEPFLVESPRSRWLVSTRDGNISAKLGATEIKLGTLDKGQSLALLRNWAGRDDARFTEIADKLDGHPLALKLVGARLRDGITAAEWIATYDGIARVKLGRTPKTTDESIELCFDASMTALSDDDRPLYHALGIFPEDVWIPESVISLFWRKRAGVPPEDCAEILTELERLALVERDTHQRAVQMHDLLHSYNRHKIRAPYATLQTEFVAALGDLHALPDAYAWRNLAYHLIEGKQTDRLYVLLTDYHWLHAKLDATDSGALESDCAAYLAAVTDGEAAQTIRLIQSALRMSAYVLAQDKTQLPYQLTGRLWVYREKAGIAALWRQAQHHGVLELLTTPAYPPMRQVGGEPLRTLFGHTETVNGALQLKDGRLLSWSWDKTLRLWSSDGQPIATLTGHTREVRGAVQLADGRLLSWSWDTTLRLWSSDGQPLATLTGHTHEVRGAVQLADGRFLSWSSDSILRLWSPHGEPLATLTGHTDWVTGALQLNDGRLLSWSRDKTLRLWSPYGQPLATLTDHTDEVWGALQLADGRVLSWSDDKTLRLWSPDGQPLTTLTGHTDRVTGALQLADGRFLSWAGEYNSNDHTLRLWSPDGQPLATLTGHIDRVNGALQLADGRVLSWSNDNTLRLWSPDGQPLATLTGHTDRVTGALQLADGRFLSWAGEYNSNDHTLRLWSPDGQPLATLTGHTDGVLGALQLADGRLLSWSTDTTLRLWSPDAQTSEEDTAHAGAVWGVLRLSDGRVLSWSDDTTLRLWSPDGQPLAPLTGHTREVTGAVQLADGRVLSWSDDHTLRLWSPDGHPLTTLTGHTDSVKSVRQLADGRLLSWAEYDDTLRLWSPDGHPLAMLTGYSEEVRGALQLADGRLLSWAEGLFSEDHVHVLSLWSPDGHPLATLTGHTKSVNGALQLADGRLLSWSLDNTLRLWSPDGQPLATLTGHTQPIWRALQLMDGRILSWSHDNTLRLWSPDGHPLTTLTGHTREVRGALQLADRRLLSWSDDKNLRLWSHDGEPIASLDDWLSQQAHFEGWAQAHGVDVHILLRAVYAHDPNALESPYARGVGNHLWVYGVGQFIGDARFTRVAVSGQTIVVGDKAGRVIFLRVRGGG